MFLLATATAFMPSTVRSSTRKDLQLQALPDASTLIPAFIFSTGLIFAIFNIENKIDITDKGLAESRRKKRNERLAKGEDLSRNKENLDPYRWRVFEDDTDDDNFDMLESNKSGGGCG